MTNQGPTYAFWPYDEVSLAVSDTGEGEQPVAVTVRAPWLTLTINFPAAQKPILESLEAKLENKTLEPNDIQLVTGFFHNLSTYPLCYILPAKKPGASFDQHDVLATGLPQATPKAVLEQIEVKELPSIELDQWGWDVGTALSFAKAAENKIHPESLFSVIRRFHLLETMRADRGSEVFQRIKKLVKEDFQLAAALVVRQNHYVTQKCQEALKPAVDVAQSQKGAVEEFLNEEKGHDLILGAALQAVIEPLEGSAAPYANIEDVPVTPHTVCLMELLKLAASRNLLAFAMIVDFFERSSYQDKDPLAQLLEDGGYDKPARHINRHMQINDAGGHDHLAIGFLENMGPVSVEYATEAVHLAELTSQVMTRVTNAAYALFEKQRQN